MKQCQKCGTFNEDNDSLCSGCGSTLGITMGDTNSFDPVISNTQPVLAKNNGMAIASMVLGIAGILCCCSGPLMGILAVIFGFISRKKIRESDGTQKGDGMALAGIILGFVAIGLTVLGGIFYAVNIFSSNEFWNEFQRQFQEGMNQNR